MLICASHQTEMVHAYLAGATPSEAAALFGYSRQACWGALRRAGVKTRTKSEARRRHPVDESFFDLIDTEEKAYWLGFITADGCVSDGRLIVNLKAWDRGHLVKLADAMSSDAPIRDVFRRDGRKACVIEVCSVRIELALKRLGIMSRKSLVVKPWSGPHELMRHYWRGVVDGDGCLHKKSRSAGGWTVSLVGSKDVVDSFRSWTRGFVDTDAVVHKKKSIWCYEVGGTAAPRELARALYSGCSVSLDRKCLKAAELLKVRDQR